MKLRVEERKNPKTGKPVTVISDIIHNPQVIEKLSKKLKSACGAGGFVEGKTIIIQGDHVQKISNILKNDGFDVKVM